MLIALVYDTQIDKRIHLTFMQINTWISKGKEKKKKESIKDILGETTTQGCLADFHTRSS